MFSWPLLVFFALRSIAANEDSMSFVIVLRQRNIEKLKDLALEVSTPGSPRYGRYLSQEEIDDLTKPSEDAVKVVTDWLTSKSVEFEVTRESVHVQAARQAVTDILQARAAMSQENNKALNEASKYALPPSVADRVTAVYGLQNSASRLSGKRKSAYSISDVTPAVIANTYKIDKIDVNRTGANRQGILAFDLSGEGISLPMVVSKDQVRKYFENLVPEAASADAEINKFVGSAYNASWEAVCSSDDGKCTESQADVEIMMAVAPGVKTEFWHFGTKQDLCHELYEYTSALLTNPDPPLTNSVSYGQPEVYGERHIEGCSTAQMDAVDANLAKLAARGISMIVASGDHGPEFCNASDARPGCPANMSGDMEFFTAWPASSPWVTSVGGSSFANDRIGAEEVSMLADGGCFTSGGGFSKRFSHADAPWQKEAVLKYLQRNTSLPDFPPLDAINAQGRAVPDVSALGSGFTVYDSGHWTPFGGTSASAPLFAAIISLLNEERLRARMPPLGFLNPLLYANPDAFTDIVSGTNKVQPPFFCPWKSPYGYAAAPGWDAATGLGTPRFDKLREAALQTSSAATTLFV